MIISHTFCLSLIKYTVFDFFINVKFTSYQAKIFFIRSNNTAAIPFGLARYSIYWL